MNLRPVCKFEFYHCGPVEKKLERSICLVLVVAARQSRVGSNFPNTKILILPSSAPTLALAGLVFNLALTPPHSRSKGTHSSSKGAQSRSKDTHSRSKGPHSRSKGQHNCSKGTHSRSKGTYSRSKGTHRCSKIPAGKVSEKQDRAIYAKQKFSVFMS